VAGSEDGACGREGPTGYDGAAICLGTISTGESDGAGISWRGRAILGSTGINDGAMSSTGSNGGACGDRGIDSTALAAGATRGEFGQGKETSALSYEKIGEGMADVAAKERGQGSVVAARAENDIFSTSFGGGARGMSKNACGTLVR